MIRVFILCAALFGFTLVLGCNENSKPPAKVGTDPGDSLNKAEPPKPTAKDDVRWDNAKVARLTIKVTEAQMSEIATGEWTKPDVKDFAKIEGKRGTLILQGLARLGSNEKVRDEKALLTRIFLIREDMAGWPNKDGAFDKDTLNVKGTEIFIRPGTKWFETYDLVLTGKPTTHSVISGKVSGILGGESTATKLKDSSFELRPVFGYNDIFAEALFGPARDVGQGLKIIGERTNLTMCYNVQLVAGKTYVINMTSNDLDRFRPYLKLLDFGGKTLATGGNDETSQVVFRALVSGPHQVSATSVLTNFVEGSAVPFTLDIKEKE